MGVGSWRDVLRLDARVEVFEPKRTKRKSLHRREGVSTSDCLPLCRSSEMRAKITNQCYKMASHPCSGNGLSCPNFQTSNTFRFM